MSHREPGTLCDFIERHHTEIIGEFSAFARTLMPGRSDMSERDFRDHAKEMLTAIVRDMYTEQSVDEQSAKSMGSGEAHVMEASGRLHAEGRIHHGFSPAQVLAEFRALRASVLRLYELTGHTDLAGVRRFNEAIDEALTESITVHAAKTDLYRDQFVGVLSHDLRSPLSAITAGAALLAASADADQRQARVAARILNSAQRMARMIADLLDLTRTRLGGEIPLKRALTDLEQVCHEVVLEIQASRSDALVHFSSTGNVTGSWDADRLAQVVANLIGNAIQHGSKGPVTLDIREVGDSVKLSVHNDGAPIPTEAKRTIFEPLTRGGSDGTQGIGLGLFIARAIVVAHGGDISVTSTESSGTTFEVELPKRPPGAPAQSSGSP